MRRTQHCCCSVPTEAARPKSGRAKTQTTPNNGRSHSKWHHLQKCQGREVKDRWELLQTEGNQRVETRQPDATRDSELDTCTVKDRVGTVVAGAGLQ